MAVLFIVIQFIYLPAHDNIKELARVLEAEKTSLTQVKQLRQDYLNLSPNPSGNTDLIKNRPAQFTLFSFLDQQASKTGVKGHIDYMKPHTRDLDNSPYTLSIVKLKLKQIVLTDFIRFLQGVETQGTGIGITSLSMTQTGKKKNRLNATIEVQTLINKEGS